MKKLINKNILIISPDKWTELYVSKHHYARYLSKNNNVWFLNSLGNPALNDGIKITKHENYNINIVDYKPIVRGIHKLPLFALNLLLKTEIKQLKKAIGQPIDIVWSFDPNRFWNLNYWEASTKIYHTVDFHYKARFEDIVCKTADIVLGVADLIIEPIKKYNSNIHKINHGVDYDASKNNTLKENIDLPGNNNIKSVYLGNFHRDVNYELLYQLSKENPTVDFILIGPYKGQKMGALKISEHDYTRLTSNNNLFFIGEIKSDDIQSYLNKIDISLLLFNDDAQIKHCNPHKVLFYLLSGKVIVSNIIDEYKNSNLLVMAKSTNMYSEEFKKVVENIQMYNSSEMVEKRRKYALQNTYEKQIQRIESLLN